MVEGQIGMQAANDMEFGGAFADALLGALVNLFQGKGIRAGGARIASEGTEFAMSDADIGGIDVTIDIVVGDIPVALFPYVIGEPAYGKRSEERRVGKECRSR